MHDPLPIMKFLKERLARGENAVLVTLTGVIGSSSRAPGTHMAVSSDGTAIGSFSGGCVEAAVIAEALAMMGSPDARLVRFGVGSPYIDIRLPCGGGIDLLFTPNPSLAMICEAISTLRMRRPIVISFAPSGGLSVRPAFADDRICWQADLFLVRHDPVLRIVVLGHGAEPIAMLRVAHTYGADAVLLSPDPVCVKQAKSFGVPAERLDTVTQSGKLRLDQRTAVIFLFHDHDWETELLLEALEQAPLFIGAMGSRRTHAERLERLRHRGASTTACARIVGPVGLVPAMRDPAGLAISIMAQILEALNTAARDPTISDESSGTLPP